MWFLLHMFLLVVVPLWVFSFLSSYFSSTAPSWKYDVFLSFRGTDTRKDVASRLYDRLQNKIGIKTFKDDMRLEPGTGIYPSLLRAIEDSRFAVVVFSENYASSEWCLNELNHIFRCMKRKNRILPLFYSVDPSHVRNQTGKFGEVFTELAEKYKNNPYKVKEWRASLKGVGRLSGWHSDNFPSEAALIDRVVKDVLWKAVRRRFERTA